MLDTFKVYLILWCRNRTVSHFYAKKGGILIYDRCTSLQIRSKKKVIRSTIKIKSVYIINIVLVSALSDVFEWACPWRPWSRELICVWAHKYRSCQKLVCMVTVLHKFKRKVRPEAESMSQAGIADRIPRGSKLGWTSDHDTSSGSIPLIMCQTVTTLFLNLPSMF